MYGHCGPRVGPRARVVGWVFLGQWVWMDIGGMVSLKLGARSFWWGWLHVPVCAIVCLLVYGLRQHVRLRGLMLGLTRLHVLGLAGLCA